MIRPSAQSGFSLVELLVATTIFAVVVAGVSQLFTSALDIQRRAIGVQKIEENAQYVIESISREVRVSTVESANAPCGAGSSTLDIMHPTNGAVTYAYVSTGGIGGITRNGQLITSGDVNFATFKFCIMGAGADDIQARVTMPMTIESISGRAALRTSVSLQTTIVSRDLAEDLSN
jgi:prepilin-type N-terminal cleavage/methylation domain-containing protein